ncbi:hypothetical protein HPC49_08220 [Pyxidicoccus fallax]|uniref:Uncharacterized protein n=1 Tax=Pyxidicoccus fallax TaxID=394095 RepID=A0A848LE46_9BACT|nr:kelch repeat-containing protein [Pyxidicoccus fallax]NMO15073.1 hypothetical protein [Pyxidicoccus fallax]NPC78239.1 hypothetical protein [Pyxidicoccus fallax]
MFRLLTRFSLVVLAVSFASGCSPTELPQESESSSQSQPLSVQTGSLNVARTSFTLTLLQDGTVLVTGGYGWGGNVSTVERYNPATGQFDLAASLANGRSSHTATLLQDGRVLVVGGFVGSPSTGVTNTVEIYNPVTGTWSNGAPTAVPHARHTATLLQDGRVLVVAGTNALTTTAGGSTICEIYNPTTNTWSYVASLPKKRLDHTATRLLSGKVLVAGGLEYDLQGSPTFVPAVEFDPVTSTWTPRASPFTGRTRHQAFLMGDGSVLLVGGTQEGTGTFNEAELYNPVTGTWSATATMNGRADAVGAVLADGRVLVAGGYEGGYHASSAIYDPSTGAWSAGDPLLIARYMSQAVRLNDGRVLVASGYSNGARTTHAELISTCTVSVTCASQGKNCGTIPDGCGGTLNCGTCGSGELCEANVCVTCTPTTCAQEGKNCGSIADGCGGTLDCGACSGTDVCSSNVCVSCTPTTCAAQGRSCGTLSDGCGGTLSCGTCSEGSTCGSAGVCLEATPPTVSVSSPSSGAVVTGTVAIQASASDNVGVVRTDFYVGSSFIGSSTGPTFSVSWNSASVANGNWVLTARAFDAAGNSATSAGVTVLVSNPVVVMATHDGTLRVPRCSTPAAGCDSGTLLVGRGPLGPEPQAPNTLQASCADGTAGGFHNDESLDRLVISTTDNTVLAAGKQVRIDATVWAFSSYSSDMLDLYYATSLSNPAWTFLTTLTPTRAGSQTLSHTFTLPTGAQVIRGRFRYGGSAAPCGVGSYTDHDDLVFATSP